MVEAVDEQIGETGSPVLGWLTGKRGKQLVHIGVEAPVCGIEVEGPADVPLRPMLRLVPACPKCEKKL